MHCAEKAGLTGYRLGLQTRILSEEYVLAPVLVRSVPRRKKRKRSPFANSLNFMAAALGCRFCEHSVATRG